MTGWLTLAGLIVVALITAYTTDRRLSRQIDAERERQERELRAEAQRQAAALAHDRELSDLADLRSVLDTAAIAVHKARNARDEIRASFTEHGAKLPADVKQRLMAAGTTIDELSMRIHLRLGAKDPISERFSAMAGALLTTWRQVAFLEEDSGESMVEKHRAIEAATTAFNEAMAYFFVAAVKRMGTVATADEKVSSGANGV